MKKLIKAILTFVVVFALLAANFVFAFDTESDARIRIDNSILSLTSSLNSLDTGIPACVEVTFWFPNFREKDEVDIFCFGGGRLCGIEKKCEFCEECGYCQQTVCKTVPD